MMAAACGKTMNSINSIPNHRTHFSRAILVSAALLLFLGSGLLVTIYFLPRVYFAKVTMEVKPDSSGAFVCFGGGAEGRKAFVAAQLSILQSKEILNQVIKNLVLDIVWSNDEQPLSMEQAFARLTNSLELRDVDGKGMFEIGVYDTDPQEAANIANTIAVVYQQKRLADFQRNIDKGMEQLKDEVEKQRQRADEAVVEMTRIRERDGIVDANPADYGTSLDSPKGRESLNSYVETKTRALQARRIYEAAKTKYAVELLERDTGTPSKIWKTAEPPSRPAGFSFRLLRHALSR